MAIQNFLSGGYYGKLGDTVGQRWHNIRTIRSYVVPANPRTPAQQSNRVLFKIATRLAQEAYNINKGSPLWDTTNMGQFSQLVSLAKRRLQAGMSEEEALPIYPDGYIPNTLLDNFNTTWTNWPTSVSWSCDNYPMIETRSFSIIIHWFNEFTQQFEDFQYVDTFTEGEYVHGVISIQNKFSLPAGSTITVASLDDEAHNNQSIYLPAEPIEQPALPVLDITFSFDAPIMLDTPTEYYIPIHNYPVVANEEVTFYIRFFNPDTNQWEINGFPSYSFENDLGKILLEITFSSSFPVGSRIEAGSSSLDGATALFNFQWPDFPFSLP